MLTTQTLLDNLAGYATYFVLRGPLDLPSFTRVASVLSDFVGPGSGSVEAHWKGLLRRADASSRWDLLVPRYEGKVETREDYLAKSATHVDVDNVARVRGYSSYEGDGIRYTIDLFNPGNELELPYRGAGETVLVLLMQESDPPAVRFPRAIRDRLVENEQFYSVVRGIAGAVDPEYVCGTYSVAAMCIAYQEGRAAAHLRPWDFLFPLYLLGKGVDVSPQRTFSGGLVGMQRDLTCQLGRVDRLADGRSLIQVRSGFDARISWEHFAVAKAFGMTSVEQLVEGRAS